MSRQNRTVYANAANSAARVGGLLLALLLSTASFAAQPLPTVPELPLELANKAVMAAVHACSEDGYHEAAAVVDRAGVLLAFARADEAGSHTVDSSFRKAYTAASLREPTAKLAELIAKHPELQAMQRMNSSILMLAGGLPIYIDGQFVGGIGAGGAPGGELDVNCARAGLRAIGAQSEAGES